MAEAREAQRSRGSTSAFSATKHSLDATEEIRTSGKQLRSELSIGLVRNLKVFKVPPY